ncbi:hypothetical protein, partial [Faecalispora jeddahensis]|uniref:hypothetical protein n=1 Tax=Faecalispora jeddahensis TaxID=1414721 RepID=UPI0028A92786
GASPAPADRLRVVRKEKTHSFARFKNKAYACLSLKKPAPHQQNFPCEGHKKLIFNDIYTYRFKTILPHRTRKQKAKFSPAIPPKEKASALCRSFLLFIRVLPTAAVE